MVSKNSLHVKNLTHAYNQRVLLKGINFIITCPAVLQIIGINGIGKSTLLRILAGLLKPQYFEAFFCGKTVDFESLYSKRKLFYSAHLLGVKQELTVKENIFYDFHLLGITKLAIEKVLQKVGLFGYANEYVKHLSRGQQQRIMLVKFMLSPAQLFLIDEPLTGLDSEGIEIFKSVVDQQIQSGALIVLATHYPITLVNIRQTILDLENNETVTH